MGLSNNIFALKVLSMLCEMELSILNFCPFDEQLAREKIKVEIKNILVNLFCLNI
jgi:hypothetical protein